MGSLQSMPLVARAVLLTALLTTVPVAAQVHPDASATLGASRNVGGPFGERLGVAAEFLLNLRWSDSAGAALVTGVALTYAGDLGFSDAVICPPGAQSSCYDDTPGFSGRGLFAGWEWRQPDRAFVRAAAGVTWWSGHGLTRLQAAGAGARLDFGSPTAGPLGLDFSLRYASVPRQTGGRSHLWAAGAGFGLR